MKLTYLGTAAAEGFPAVFCRCKYCVEARKLGGKNIRTRSQSLVNDDLLIDFPADTYRHFLDNGIEGDKIKYLLITHGHCDHFYPEDLAFRIPPYAHEMQVSTLQVVGSEGALKGLKTVPQNVAVSFIKAYETVQLGPYRITALPAKHMPGGEALFYVIEGDKTLLYAHDTGYFYEEVFSYMEEKKWVFDAVSMDCTYGNLPIMEDEHHMGFQIIGKVLDRLSQMGAVNESTVKYVNHFSHNGNPIHHLTEEAAKEYDCLVSYDGCQVIF